MIPVMIPPTMGIMGKRKGIDVPVIPIHPSPFSEKTNPKNPISQRNRVDARPARKPIIAARISRLWSCIKRSLIFSRRFSGVVCMGLYKGRKTAYYKERSRQVPGASVACLIKMERIFCICYASSPFILFEQGGP